MWLGLMHFEAKTPGPMIEVVTGVFRQNLSEKGARELQHSLTSVLGREASLFQPCFLGDRFSCARRTFSLGDVAVPLYFAARQESWAAFGKLDERRQLFLAADHVRPDSVALGDGVDPEPYLSAEERRRLQ